MDEAIAAALQTDQLIDITTTGRKTGEARRIEISFPQRVDGALYRISTPGPRGWFANLIANAQFTVHLKQSAKSGIPATATPVLDKAEGRRVCGFDHGAAWLGEAATRDRRLDYIERPRTG
jgi:hypothetical protein